MHLLLPQLCSTMLLLPLLWRLGDTTATRTVAVSASWVRCGGAGPHMMHLLLPQLCSTMLLLPLLLCSRLLLLCSSLSSGPGSVSWPGSGAGAGAYSWVQTTQLHT